MPGFCSRGIGRLAYLEVGKSSAVKKTHKIQKHYPLIDIQLTGEPAQEQWRGGVWSGLYRVFGGH